MFKLSFYGKQFLPIGTKLTETVWGSALYCLDTIRDIKCRKPRITTSSILVTSQGLVYSIISSQFMFQLAYSQQRQKDPGVRFRHLGYQNMDFIWYSNIDYFFWFLYFYHIFLLVFYITLCRTIELFSKGWFILIYFNPQANGWYMVDIL